MKIVIVGGGKVAFYLIKEFVQEHEVVIIEQNEKAANRIANQLSAEVVYGDGSVYSVLAPACVNAKIIVALTGRDETNLIACQIAKRHCGVPVSIARVNNPRNLEVMKRFGVDKSYSGTKILAEMIEQEIDYEGLRIVHRIQESEYVLVEFHLSPKSKACDRSLAEYTFPSGAKVVVITATDGQMITPRGDTVMKADELMVLVCSKKNIEQIWKEMVRR
ncbi:MAG: NAD(P)-binding domain-containing protein [Clostridiaceae bacterium]|nr:NAD(P)-binding domain-containing protein [Clostridiaceae bacterium]